MDESRQFDPTRDAELDAALRHAKDTVMQLILTSVESADSAELDRKFVMHFNGLLVADDPGLTIEVAFEDGRKIDNNLGVDVEDLLSRLPDGEVKRKVIDCLIVKINKELEYLAKRRSEGAKTNDVLSDKERQVEDLGAKLEGLK